MARPTKLNDDMQAAIVKHLTAGVTQKDTCNAVGIAESTFCDWMVKGRNAKSGALLEFSEQVTRAKAAGLVHATIRFREGMNPYDIETEATDRTSETRLRTIKHEDGTIEQVPYEYTKVIRKDSVTHHPGDWRCAKDYLSRRDPKNWAETRKNEHTGEDGIH